MKLATFWHDQNAEINSMDPTHVSVHVIHMYMRVGKILVVDIRMYIRQWLYMFM
jgi:hypothetical protein